MSNMDLVRGAARDAYDTVRAEVVHAEVDGRVSAHLDTKVYSSAFVLTHVVLHGVADRVMEDDT